MCEVAVNNKLHHVKLLLLSLMLLFMIKYSCAKCIKVIKDLMR